MSDPQSRAGKLIYIFVAGVEGVGHHGLHPVLETAFRRNNEFKQTNGELISYKKRMKRGFNQIWCEKHPFGLGFRTPLFRWYLDKFFAKQKRLAVEKEQMRVIIEDNSFPAGRYRDMDRQWRLDEMQEIIAPYADEVYFIGLYRDPIAAVFSHKQFDGGLHEHAEVIRTSLQRLNDQLNGIAPQRLRIAHYEDLIGNQEALGAMLADYLQLDAEDLAEGFAKVRPSKKDWRRDMASDDQAAMKELFSLEEAKRHWPLFLTPSQAST